MTSESSGSTSEGRFGLPRTHRVVASRDFLKAKELGRRLVHGCLILNWREVSAVPGPVTRLGVVSSKSLGKAVERNRARRLLREAFRRHRPGIRSGLDLILVARPSIARRSALGVEQDFIHGLRKAGLWQVKTS